MTVPMAAADLQPLVYSRLSGDSQLTALASVYDSPPMDADLPYVIIGDFAEADWPTFSRGGRLVRWPVIIWTDYHGGKVLHQIMSRISELIDGWVPSMTAPWAALRCDLERSTTTRSGDGTLRRGMMHWSTYTYRTS